MQIRGSIPLIWSQRPNLHWQPELNISPLDDKQLQTYRLHIQQLLTEQQLNQEDEILPVGGDYSLKIVMPLLNNYLENFRISFLTLLQYKIIDLLNRKTMRRLYLFQLNYLGSIKPAQSEWPRTHPRGPASTRRRCSQHCWRQIPRVRLPSAMRFTQLGHSS